MSHNSKSYQRQYYEQHREEILARNRAHNKSAYRKEYRRTYMKGYVRTEEGRKIRMWHDMKRRCGTPPWYTCVELRMTQEQFFAFLEDSSFNELMKNWEVSGYRRTLTPSVDRIDSRGHYEIGNIQIIPFGENTARAARSRPPGVTAHPGEHNPRAKVTYTQVLAMRECYAKGGITKRQLGEEYGLSLGGVKSILSGKSWKGDPERLVEPKVVVDGKEN